jgi:hypothetical protein
METGYELEEGDVKVNSRTEEPVRSRQHNEDCSASYGEQRSELLKRGKTETQMILMSFLEEY